MTKKPPSFAALLLDWHRRHGRHDLPWQRDWRTLRDPYRVWLSEIMLQQTQVATVIPYYERFVGRLPTLAALAAAPADEVMALWSGLGYYARARNLHACAKAVAERHGGEFPRTAGELAQLPGIGRSTANAIATFCFGAQAAILDGNVKRVLCRCFGVEGFPGEAAVERRLWELAHDLLPARNAPDYIQAQMDLGATLCTRGRPRCVDCPLADVCVARRTDRVAELPAARPKRAVPERTVTLLVLMHEDRILLEERPPAGIWGGLWSLPELAGSTEAGAAIAALGCTLESTHELPVFTHVFSHFRLRATPLLCRVRPKPGAAEPGRRWLAAAQMQSAPLPAPIRVLLDQVLFGA
jgi:A/G-specific adenine glycosylase